MQDRLRYIAVKLVIIVYKCLVPAALSYLGYVTDGSLH